MTNEGTEIELVSLSHLDAVNVAAVVPEVGADLGGDEQPQPPRLPEDIRGVNVTLRVGRRPVAYDLAAVYAAAGESVPDAYKLASPHRLCMVLLTVGVQNEGSYEYVRRIGLRVQLPDDPRVRVFDMFPRHELISLFEGGLVCRADVRMDGQVQAPSGTPLGPKSVGLPFGVSLSAGVESWLVGRISFAVYSSVVDAVGVGDSQVQWALTRNDKPLTGKDHLFGIVVSARKVARALNLRANVYAVVSNLSTMYTWPVRLEQPDWIDLPVPIQKTFPSG